jgi:hypothetical protein
VIIEIRYAGLGQPALQLIIIGVSDLSPATEHPTRTREGDRWARVHHGGWTAARSGLRDQAVSGDPQAGDPLPELTFHGLRHSAASMMLAGGADISTVSKLLGHASISITADVYAHLVAAVGQQAVDGAANLITRTVLAQPDVTTDAGQGSGQTKCLRQGLSPVGLARFELATP